MSQTAFEMQYLFEFRVIYREPARNSDGGIVSGVFSRQEVVATGEVMAVNEQSAKTHALRAVSSDLQSDYLTVLVRSFM